MHGRRAEPAGSAARSAEAAPPGYPSESYSEAWAYLWGLVFSGAEGLQTLAFAEEAGGSVPDLTTCCDYLLEMQI